MEEKIIQLLNKITEEGPNFKLAMECKEALKTTLSLQLKSFRLKEEVIYEKNKQKIYQSLEVSKEDLKQIEEIFDKINNPLNILNINYDLRGILIDVKG
jgi:Iap family predicted aminopeptidase